MTNKPLQPNNRPKNPVKDTPEDTSMDVISDKGGKNCDQNKQ